MHHNLVHFDLFLANVLFARSQVAVDLVGVKVLLEPNFSDLGIYRRGNVARLVWLVALALIPSRDDRAIHSFKSRLDAHQSLGLLWGPLLANRKVFASKDIRLDNFIILLVQSTKVVKFLEIRLIYSRRLVEKLRQLPLFSLMGWNDHLRVNALLAPHNGWSPAIKPLELKPNGFLNCFVVNFWL